MQRIIKDLLLRTGLVFTADLVLGFVLSVVLLLFNMGDEVIVNKVIFHSLIWLYFFLGFFMIPKNNQLSGIKRYVFAGSCLFFGKFFNLIVLSGINLSNILPSIFYTFLGMFGVFAEKKHPVTKKRLIGFIIFFCISVGFRAFSLIHQPADNLIEYIKNDETEKAKALIEKGADVNQTDENGATPAMWAAAGGNFDILKLLIAKGADINKKGLIFLNVEPILFYTTVLNAAIGQGHLEIVKFLVEECGVDVNEISPKINRITYYPQDIPDPHKVVEYVKNRNDFSSNVVKDYTKEFPESTLPLMISGALNKILTTRLSRKSEGGNLFKKALGERKKLDEEFPGLVRNRKHYEIFDETDGIWVPNITYAAGPNFIEITKYLIEKGININQRDQDNISALFFTAKDTALLLLENGIEVNVRENLMNSSPLGFRARFVEKDMTVDEINLWKKIVETFVQKGADINSQDNLGDTLLHNMCLNKNSSSDLVAFVVKLGADPEIKDNWGKTAKKICAEHGVEIKDEWLKKNETDDRK